MKSNQHHGRYFGELCSS